MSPWSKRKEQSPGLDGRVLAENVKRPRSDRVVLKKGAKIDAVAIGLLKELCSDLPNAKVLVKAKGKTTESIPVWTHDPNENLIGRRLGAPLVDEQTGEVVIDRDEVIDEKVREQVLDVLAASTRERPHGAGAQRAYVRVRARCSRC